MRIFPRRSLELGLQTTVSGVIESIDFRAFGRYVFVILGNEANIITQYYVVPCRLSTDPKTYDLE